MERCRAELESIKEGVEAAYDRMLQTVLWLEGPVPDEVPEEWLP